MVALKGARLYHRPLCGQLRLAYRPCYPEQPHRIFDLRLISFRALLFL